MDILTPKGVCCDIMKSINKKTLKQLYERAYNMCEATIESEWYFHRCNTIANLEPHHVKYRSRGGSDKLINLALLCHKCHDCVHGITGDWTKKYRTFSFQNEGETEYDYEKL